MVTLNVSITAPETIAPNDEFQVVFTMDDADDIVALQYGSGGGGLDGLVYDETKFTLTNVAKGSEMLGAFISNTTVPGSLKCNWVNVGNPVSGSVEIMTLTFQAASDLVEGSYDVIDVGATPTVMFVYLEEDGISINTVDEIIQDGETIPEPAEYCVVTFDSNGGTDVTQTVVLLGEAVSEPTDPLKFRNDFDGWYADEALTTPYNFSSAVTTDITLYAKWAVSTEDVVLNVTVTTPETIEADDEFQVIFTMTDAVQIAGFQYGSSANNTQGFFYDATKFTLTSVESGSGIFGTISANTINSGTIKTWWNTTNLSYRVTGTVEFMKLNFTAASDLETGSYDVVGIAEDPKLTFFTLTESYDFDEVDEIIHTGLTTMEEPEPVPEPEPEPEPEPDPETSGTCVLTYESNGGTEIMPSYVTCGTTVEMPLEPSKDGFEFVGWHSDALLTDRYNFGDTLDSSMTVYAKWISSTSNAGLIKRAINRGIKLQNDISVTATVGGVTTGDTISKGTTYEDIVGYIFKPDIKQYKVVFNDYYGNPAKTQIVNKNESAEAPTLPVVTGQTFISWDTSFTNVTSNLTINPVYNVRTYQVSFKDYDNSLIGTVQTIDYGEDATPPADPTRTGWTFKEWSGSYENVTSSRNIVATYERIVLEVTFEDYDGTVLGVFDVNYGDDAVAPDVPFRTGYDFTGWDVSLENITEDTTITAEYSIREYTVRFFNYNGSTIWDATNHTQTIEHGSNATLPATDPTRTGYTFVEWDTSHENITADTDIQAVFTINQYTVTFKDWDEEVLKTETVNHGANATPPADPTKDGNVFSDWSGNYTNVTEDRTITANYDVAVYTVTFIDWDGSTYAEERVLHGESASLPANPTREGYTFVEWDGNYETVSGDEELDAVYTVNEYTITFDTDGGSAIDAITQDYGTEITPPDDPTKEYNTFDGWNPEIPAYMPAENITVTAQWVTQTYTVTFADWDGSVIDVQTVPHGGNADLPSTPTRDGHSFLSWTGANYLNVTSDRTITASYGINTYTVTFQYEDETVIETVNVLYMQDATPPTPPVIEGLTFSEWLGDYEDVTENRTITAIYGADLYTVTFKDDDETTVLGTDVVAYGEDATPPSDPTKTGYTFDEWDGDFTNVTEDLTILATYNRNYYTVTYLDDDGTLLKTDGNVEHGTDSTPPADPTQEGKVFSGWDKSVLNIKEDTVITATYDLVVYTVTFEDYDTSFIAEYKVESGDASPEPAEPTRTGYTFTDWDVDFSNITEDLTVTAQYTINQYTLTYNVNRGTSVSAQEYDYNEALSLGSTTRVGYDFGGWYANSSLTTAFTLTNMPASDTTIYAKWTIQTFTVTFKDYDDSTIGTPQTINYGKTATAPTVSRTGYAFTGWSHSYSNVTADVTTTAQYAINKYSITFNRNGGSVVSPQTYDFGDTIVAPSNPTRTGYTFNGWSPSLPATMPSNNLTVTAQWTANQYTITFNSNGGSSVSSKTQNYGTTVTAPSAPTKSGYTFSGWFTNTGLTISYTFTTMPAQNITLYAKWTPIPYIYMGHLEDELTSNYATAVVGLQNSFANPTDGSTYSNAITNYGGAKALVVSYPASLGNPQKISRPFPNETQIFIDGRVTTTIDGVSYYVYIWNYALGHEIDFETLEPIANPTPFEVII